MGCVYFLRDGQSGRHKLGRAKSFAFRMRGHRTSNPSLELVESYETDQDKPCEAFVKRYLADKRIRGTREFFLLTESDIAEAVDAVRHYERESLPNAERVKELKVIQSTDELLGAGPEEHDYYRRLRAVRAKIDRLSLECEALENALKVRIGDACGIDGIATWKSYLRQGFNFDVFQAENAAFVAEYEDIFRKYRSHATLRRFCLQ